MEKIKEKSFVPIPVEEKSFVPIPVEEQGRGPGFLGMGLSSRIDPDTKQEIFYLDPEQNREEFYRTVVGAGRDLAQGVIDFGEFVGGFMENIVPLGGLKFEDGKVSYTRNKKEIFGEKNLTLPKISEPTATSNKLTRDLIQFAIPASRINKIIPQAVSFRNKILRAGIIGGSAEQLAFSPYEERLSNFVQSFPSLKNPVTEFLKANTEDEELVARAKMFTEGSIIGLPFDFLFNLAGRAKGATREGKDLAKHIDETADKITKEKPKPKEDMSKKSIEEEVGKRYSAEPEIDELYKPSMSLKVQKKMVEMMSEALIKGDVPIRPKRITSQFLDLMNTSRLEGKEYKELFKKYNVNQKDFAELFGSSVSDAARTLNVMSNMQKKLNATFLKDADVNAAFRNLELDEYSDRAFEGFWKRLDNARRGMMVGQLATAVRNFASQSGRVGIDVLQQGLDQSIGSFARNIQRRTGRGEMPINTNANFFASLKGFTDIYKQFNPKKFKQVKDNVDVLLKPQPTLYDKLFLRYSSDVVNKTQPDDKLQKVVNYVNFANRFQEFITRRAVFQSALDTSVRNKPEIYNNKTLQQLLDSGDLDSIRRSDLEKAVDKALEVTFAKDFNTGKGTYNQLAKGIIGGINSLPFILTSVIPFPRFLFNSLKFHAQFSPLGFIPFLGKEGMEKLAKGNTEDLSKAIIGTGMLGAAYAFRNSQYAGERWHELKVGNKTYDMRAFNPFAAYLFVGDVIKRYEEGTLYTFKAKDIISAFAGIRGGTLLWGVDQFLNTVTDNPDAIDASLAFFEETVKSTLGSFFLPLQTAKDFVTGFDPEYGIVRDTTGQGFASGITTRLPFGGTDLPAVLSFTKAEIGPDGTPQAKPIRRESSVLRQFTGLTEVSEKNAAEIEFDKFQIFGKDIIKRTKIPEIDRAYANAIAPYFETIVSEQVQTPQYLNATNSQKRFLLKEYISEAKKYARDKINNDESLVPFLAELQIKKMPKDKRRVLEEMLGKNLVDFIDKEFN